MPWILAHELQVMKVTVQNMHHVFLLSYFPTIGPFPSHWATCLKNNSVSVSESLQIWAMSTYGWTVSLWKHIFVTDWFCVPKDSMHSPVWNDLKECAVYTVIKLSKTCMALGSVRMMISLKPIEWGDYLVFIKKKKKKILRLYY